MDIPKSIENFLVDFGLNEKEIVIYIALLKSGPSTVMDISRDTGIKRSTTHNTVEELIQKGLVTQTNYGERRMVVAEDPEKLNFILDQKKWQLKQISDSLPNIISQIHTTIPEVKKTTDVGVRYYLGKKDVEYIYSEALNAKEFRAYVNGKELMKVFPNNVDKFLEAHSKRKDMQIWEIMEDSELSRNYAERVPDERYYVKFIPKGMNLSIIDYMMYDGKVAIVELEEKAKGIVIENEHFYNNAVELYKFVWNMLPK